jgi:hypothetical protein
MHICAAFFQFCLLYELIAIIKLNPKTGKIEKIGLFGEKIA